MKTTRQTISMLLLCGIVSMTSAPKKTHLRSDSIEQAKSHRFEPIVQEIEGWTVHIDPKLLEGEHSETGTRALKMWQEVVSSMSATKSNVSQIMSKNRKKDSTGGIIMG